MALDETSPQAHQQSVVLARLERRYEEHVARRQPPDNFRARRGGMQRTKAGPQPDDFDWRHAALPALRIGDQRQARVVGDRQHEIGMRQHARDPVPEHHGRAPRHPLRVGHGNDIMNQHREPQSQRALHAGDAVDVLDIPPGHAETHQNVPGVERRARQRRRQPRQAKPPQPGKTLPDAQIELMSGAAEFLALVHQPGEPWIAVRHQARRRIPERRVVEGLRQELEIHRLEALGEAVEPAEADLAGRSRSLIEGREDLHLHALDAGRLRRAVEMLEEILDLEPDHRARRPAGAVARWREPVHTINPSSTLPSGRPAGWPHFPAAGRPRWISFWSTLYCRIIGFATGGHCGRCRKGLQGRGRCAGDG